MTWYKGRKTGNIYDNLVEAQDALCRGKLCNACPLYNCIWGDFCGDWCEEHPEEAARIMGLEAIDESAEASTPLDKPAPVKPRLAEVWGGGSGKED